MSTEKPLHKKKKQGAGLRSAHRVTWLAAFSSPSKYIVVQYRKRRWETKTTRLRSSNGNAGQCSTCTAPLPRNPWASIISGIWNGSLYFAQRDCTDLVPAHRRYQRVNNSWSKQNSCSTVQEKHSKLYWPAEQNVYQKKQTNRLSKL